MYFEGCVCVNKIKRPFITQDESKDRIKLARQLRYDKNKDGLNKKRQLKHKDEEYKKLLINNVRNTEMEKIIFKNKKTRILYAKLGKRKTTRRKYREKKNRKGLSATTPIL